MSEQLPASDTLLEQLAAAVKDVREHEHPARDDIYCLNLSCYMGERMAAVLKRLDDERAEVERLQGQWKHAEVQLQKLHDRINPVFDKANARHGLIHDVAAHLGISLREAEPC